MRALRALGFGLVLCLAAEVALGKPTESVIYGEPPRRPPPEAETDRPAPRKPAPERPSPEDPDGEGERPPPERPPPAPRPGSEPPGHGGPGRPAAPGDASSPGPRPPAAPPPKAPPPKASPPARPGTLMPWGRPPGKEGATDGTPGQGPGEKDAPARPIRHGDGAQVAPGVDRAKIPGVGLVIDSVRVLGNTKTKKETVLTAARVPVGKPLTLELVERIRRDLLTAGFVRSVEVNWEIVKGREDRVALFLTVKEKISWFVAPSFSYAQGQYGGSIAFGDRNLLGSGKLLRFFLGYNTESQRFTVRYKDPNIAYTPFYWATMADYTRSIFKDYDPTKAGMRRGLLLRQQTFQRFSTDIEAGYRWYHWVTTGVRYRFGLVDMERPICLRASPLGSRTFQRCPTSPDDLDPAMLGASWYVGPEALLTDHGLWVDHTSHRAKFWNWRRDAGIVLLPELSRMHNVYGMQHGFSVSGHLSINHRYLGGSFNYVTWMAEYDHALSFGRSPVFGARHNLVWHVEHGQNHNAPYFRDLRVGGTDLRGFISQQFAGDSLTRATLEYRVHMFKLGWLMFRAAAFWDTAWVFFRKAGSDEALMVEQDDRRRFYLPGSPGPRDLRSWHNSIGAGLRIYIKGLSIGTLGVDLAYGIDVNKVRLVVMLGN